MPPPPPLSPEKAARIRRRLRRLSRLLDAEYRLPGTRLSFGIDPLIGLIPGIGDAAGLVLSSYILYEARRLGVSRRTRTRMTFNLGLDAVVGVVPGVGDLFDFAFKANLRNLDLIERDLGERDAQPPH